jgi:hypothetical protein
MWTTLALAAALGAAPAGGHCAPAHPATIMPAAAQGGVAPPNKAT